MIKAKENRDDRFSIRATAKQKELIAHAASRINKTISEFVLESALEVAEALELDNADVVVNREKYKQFLAALEDDEVKQVLNFVKDSRKEKRSASAKSISTIFEELSNEVRLDDWKELPVDGADNHDHYLYGSEKKTE